MLRIDTDFVLAAVGAGLFVLTSLTAAEAQETCEPGALGEIGDYSTMGEDQSIARVSFQHQCYEVLSDGALVPEGYAVTVYEECVDERCAGLPVLATAQNNGDRYAARYLGPNGPINIVMRKTEKGNLRVTAVRSASEKGGEKSRARYRMQPTQTN